MSNQTQNTNGSLILGCSPNRMIETSTNKRFRFHLYKSIRSFFPTFGSDSEFVSKAMNLYEKFSLVSNEMYKLMVLKELIECAHSLRYLVESLEDIYRKGTKNLSLEEIRWRTDDIEFHFEALEAGLSFLVGKDIHLILSDISAAIDLCKEITPEDKDYFVILSHHLTEWHYLINWNKRKL